MNKKVVFEDFSDGFVKSYDTIARKDLQFASVSWFVLAWLALKWIPPRLGWSLAMYAVEIISCLCSWSCVTNLVVGLCVWSKSFKGKATLQKRNSWCCSYYLPPQKLVDAQKIPVDEKKIRKKIINDQRWYMIIYDYVIVIVPMQSSEHHLCSIAMAGNLPEEENH